MEGRINEVDFPGKNRRDSLGNRLRGGYSAGRKFDKMNGHEKNTAHSPAND
jgi:hypothetical protein